MELNKPLKYFIKKKEEKQVEPKLKSPRKQTKPNKSLAGLPIKHQPEEIPENNSSDEEINTAWQEKTNNEGNNQKPDPETTSTTSRQSQRSKRKPDWYGQNIMVSKLDEKEGEKASGSQTNEEIEIELKAIPNFEAMTQKEIDHWVKN